MSATQKTPPVVTLLPTAPFLIELQSQRFNDLVRALTTAGFVISNVLRPHRFRIDDAKPQL